MVSPFWGGTRGSEPIPGGRVTGLRAHTPGNPDVRGLDGHMEGLGGHMEGLGGHMEGISR